MSRHLTIALLTLVLSFGILAVASVSISPAIPDVVIVQDRDSEGGVTTSGYTFTDAFDFRDYLSVEGVTRDSILWSFVSDDADGIGASDSILKVTTIGDYGAGDDNITGVGEAGGPVTLATLSVFEDPIAAQAWEDITFTAETGFEGEDDVDTSSIRVWYVEAGEDVGFGAEDRDRLIADFSTEQLWEEDWSSLDWNMLDSYLGGNVPYGDITIDGSASDVGSVSNNQLTLGFGAGNMYASYKSPEFDVDAGETYLVKVPVQVNATKSGTGLNSYPIIRILALHEGDGIKGPDMLMYAGYPAASNQMVDYYLAFTSESASDDFTVRIDVVNAKQEAFDVVVDAVTISKVTGMPVDAEWSEDWASLDDWNMLDSYLGGNVPYGNITIDGSASAVASVSGGVMSYDFAAGDMYASYKGPQFSVDAGKTYLVKVPTRVNASKDGAGLNSYPIIRQLALHEGDGIKGPDLLIYAGYPAAQNDWVNYYLAFTAESSSDDFTLRLDVVNAKQEAFSVDFGQVEIFMIY